MKKLYKNKINKKYIKYNNKINICFKFCNNSGQQYNKESSFLNEDKISDNLINPITRGSKIKINSIAENDKIEDFVVKAIKHYKDFDITCYSLEHITTKLRLNHFDCKDQNNVFAFHFNTPAFNNTGIFHILEHLTLAGSKVYKERDPFFKMIKRSLKSYMNAWTGNDFTMYPFATTNFQDFKNLREVYYNSVFHPKLDYYDYLQEGWRYEILNNDNNNISNNNLKNGNNLNLIYNGVVLNEMKGEMIKPDVQFIEALNRHLFNGYFYQFNSGGNPEFIPNLEYEDILKAHEKYYSFNNCSTITYGDFGINDNAVFLSEAIQNDIVNKKLDYNSIITNFKNNIDSFIVNEPNNKDILWSKPKHVTEFYQPDLSLETKFEDYNKNSVIIETDKEEHERKRRFEENNQTWKFAISFVTNKTSDGNKYMINQNIINTSTENAYLTFKLTLLSQLLMDTPSSPFYKKFLDGNIAPAYIHGYGYSSDLKYGVFSIGFMDFKGNKTTVDKIENEIMNTLYEVSKTGFEESQIKEILHLLEYEFMKPKEEFGINILEKSFSFFTHSNNPFTLLELPNFVHNLKYELFTEKKKVFEELIVKYLLNNNHRVHMTLKPKKDIAIETNKKESTNLLKIEKSMNEQDIKKIVYDNNKLVELQNSNEEIEDLSNVSLLEEKNQLTNKNSNVITYKKLPNLSLNSIPLKTEEIRLVNLKTAYNVPLIFVPQNTNNITFIRIKLNLKNIPTKYKNKIQLYSSILPRLGSASTEYKEFQNKLNTNSSGLSIGLYNDISPFTDNECLEYIIFEISFLNSKIETALNLLLELISEPDFYDKNNLNNIIKQKSVALASDISENELRYAKDQAGSALRPNKLIYNNYQQELEIIKLGGEIVKASDSKYIIGKIIEDIIILHNLLFVKENISFSMHGDKDNIALVESKLGLLLNSVKTKNEIFEENLNENNDISILNENKKLILNSTETNNKNNQSNNEDNDIILKDSNFTSDMANIQENNDIKNIKNEFLNPLQDIELNPGLKLVIKTPSQISNCTEAFLVPNYCHPDFPKLIVAANLISLNYLHKEIRERGGAYGSGCRFDSGICFFFQL